MSAALFRSDPLGVWMAGLIAFFALVIGLFSRRYLAGDERRSSFFLLFALLVLSQLLLCFANHLALFFGALAMSNLLLVRLMVHKKGWEAARQGGRIAARNAGLGMAALLLGFVATGKSSIAAVNEMAPSLGLSAGLGLILVAAMAQSAIWPFHRWLLSTLNAPTPVSAFMHAGLINGGGFILARFAGAYCRVPALLTGLFCLGLVTALLGTFWKLFQSDVKRMLVCSTMGQMGFMMVQCSLGLFPAAIAHLSLHGMFKGYLFLNVGNFARQPRREVPTRCPCRALLCGLPAAVVCAAVKGGPPSFVLLAVVWFAGAQLAQALLEEGNMLIAGIGAAFLGVVYAVNVMLIGTVVAPIGVSLPLTSIHLVGIGAMFFSWVLLPWLPRSRFWPQIYRWALETSQPHPKSVTARRGAYHYREER